MRRIVVNGFCICTLLSASCVGCSPAEDSAGGVGPDASAGGSSSNVDWPTAGNCDYKLVFDGTATDSTATGGQRTIMPLSSGEAFYCMRATFDVALTAPVPARPTCTQSMQLASLQGTGAKGLMLASAALSHSGAGCEAVDGNLGVTTFAAEGSPSIPDIGPGTYGVQVEVAPFSATVTVADADGVRSVRPSATVMGANLLSSLEPTFVLGDDSPDSTRLAASYSNLRIWADVGRPDTTGAGGAGGTSGSGGTSGAGGSGGALDAGAGAGGQGGAGAGGTAGSDAGPGPLDCTTGSGPVRYEVTNSEQSRFVPLPLDLNTPYRRLTVRFRFTASDWGTPCYNPASSQGFGFPFFNKLINVRRGPHFCKGGGLYGISLQGPGPGSGAAFRANAQTNFKAAYHNGSGCGSADIKHGVFNQTHNITLNTGYDVSVVWDKTTQTLSAAIGPRNFSGTIPAGVEFSRPTGQPEWGLSLGFPGGFLECFDSAGNHDSSQPCCHGPSIGWVYEDVEWELCQ